MGFIRGSAVVVISIALFLSLFLGNLFLTLSSSLEYETAQPKLVSIGENLINESGMYDEIKNNYESILLYCANFNEPFKIEEYNLTIPCEIINEGQEKTIEYGINQFIDNIYYKEYNCTFIECVKNPETTTVIISETAKNYWNDKFNLAFLITIILAILLFIIIEGKASFFIVAGILTILSALPFGKINWALNFFNDKLIAEIFSVFFTKSYNVFLLMAIIGTAILILGIIFKVLGIGISFSKSLGKIFSKQEKEEENEGKENLTKEEIKGIVKSEISKEKKKDEIKKLIKKEVRKK